MIQVGMGEQDMVDGIRGGRRRLPVAAEIVSLLEHSAVDQQAEAGGLQEVPRTSDLTGGTDKLNSHIF